MQLLASGSVFAAEGRRGRDEVLTSEAHGQLAREALPRPLPFIYILGAGHSGSTLLTMLLGAHPDVTSIGELKAPAIGSAERYTCSCGQTLSTCSFWSALATEVSREGHELDMSNGSTDIRRVSSGYVSRLLRPLHRGPLAEALRDAALRLSPVWPVHQQRIQSLTAAIARAACRVSGASVFVDGSKTGIHLKYLLRNPELDVKIIRLVRDGRGVSLSYRKAEGLSIERAAHIWKRSNEEAETVVGELPLSRWLDLRYERLCSDVDRVLGEVFSFVGVDPRGARRHSGVQQHVLGNNNMRLNAREIRLDEKWRHTLTASELSTFHRIAGALNNHLGYTK
jgi:hypothetical protein